MMTNVDYRRTLLLLMTHNHCYAWWLIEWWWYMVNNDTGEDFLAYGCANTSLNQFPFAFAKTSIQARSQLFKAATHQTKTQQICFLRLWMCKRKLEQIPFCTCQNPNPNTLSSSELLPTNKEATLQHLLRMWAKIGDQSCVSCMEH